MRGIGMFTFGLLVGIVGTIVVVRALEREQEPGFDELSRRIQGRLEALEMEGDA